MQLPTPPDLTEEFKAEKDPERRGILKIVWYAAIGALTLAGTFIAAYIALSKKSDVDCHAEVSRVVSENDSLKRTVSALYDRRDIDQVEKDKLREKIAFKDSLLYVAGTASLQSIATKDQKTKKIIKSTK